MPILSFQEAITQSGPTRTLLLGNGFSRDYSDILFNYKTFVDRMRRDTSYKDLISVFDDLGTEDFEQVMATLAGAARVCNILCDAKSCVSKLSYEEIRLRAALIAFITSTHPANSNAISTDMYSHAANFLSNFDAFYTTNYDILLYWTLLNSSNTEHKIDYIDGFCEYIDTHLSWKARDDQNVFYLHGAVFLYRSRGIVAKIRYNNKGIDLIQQVRTNINAGQLPLFVSAGVSSEKESLIQQNRYLWHSLEAFSSIQGTLFIHGHSLSELDEHICRRIKENSRITHVCVSIRGDERSQGNIMRRARAETLVGDAQLLVYQAESANVWRD